MAGSFRYHACLAFCAADLDAAREITSRLLVSGLRVPLDPAPQVLRGGKDAELLCKESAALVMLMSSRVGKQEWITFERQSLQFRGSEGKRFIPVRLDECPFPEALKPFAHLDWWEYGDRDRLTAICHLPERHEAATEKREPPLLYTFQGNDRAYSAIATHPDGSLIVAGSFDGTLEVWDTKSRTRTINLPAHTDAITSVAISVNTGLCASASHDGKVRVWDLTTGKRRRTLSGHSDSVMAIAITPDGTRLLSSSMDSAVKLWFLSAEDTKPKTRRFDIGNNVIALAATDSGMALLGHGNLITIYDFRNQKTLIDLTGHTSRVMAVAATRDGRIGLTGSEDRTVRVWDLNSGHCIAILEGHTGTVQAVSVTPDGSRAISCSDDGTIRVWDLRNGVCEALVGSGQDPMISGSITADGDCAVGASSGGKLLAWDLSGLIDTANADAVNIRYTNAKVLLVGDSGVGKSGLAIRLTEDTFQPTMSTDAVWATQIRIPLDGTGETEREIWLWDFAGQADYRLIHQLFMDETALAVLVFNPQSEDPFEGLAQWDHAITRAARRNFVKLLVAARCDRGGLMVSDDAITAFLTDHGFAAYYATSALSGAGCSELRNTISESIPWGAIPWTASPKIFRALKNMILQLKDEGVALLRMAELKQRIEMAIPSELFTMEQLHAVVGLLAGPGLVWKLEFGDFVLLRPELINAYAAAVIRSIRANMDEIGCISEDSVINGILDYQDFQRLSGYDEQIILRAMHQTFVDHGLCLREHTEGGPVLVFPSYFKRERPDLEGHPLPLVKYTIAGALDEIYATLVVRLHHTPVFEKDRLWKFAADFRTQEGRRVGLKMTKTGEGKADITVYVDAGVPDDTKVTFVRYVHDHLKLKDPSVARTRHYVCGNCGIGIENREAIKRRLTRGLTDMICANCENRVLLTDLVEQRFGSDEIQARTLKLETQAQMSIDNESRELILVGHAFAVAGEAGQIFRPVPNSDWGIDGEIEFKDERGNASGRRVYLQLKSGDSYLYRRERDGKEVFTVKNPRHSEYWVQHEYPVMLVIRTSDNRIRWMNVTDYLRTDGLRGKEGVTKQIIFEGEPFTALSLQRHRDRVLRLNARKAS